MGSSSSKFRKALQRGEGVEAMQIYLKNTDIKRNLDPNCSYGENHGHNTPLHYASMHGIRAFVREFLAENANPNIRNSNGQNSLHCICLTDRRTDAMVDRTRAECLSSLLEWTSSVQDVATIEIDAKDKAGNTPLHYAASSGLMQCVKLLVANGASLYEENVHGETACDCAIKHHLNEIASFLESRMVFSGSSSANAFDEPVFTRNDNQQYRGLCAQDLQEAKDLMLVETADMLRVPLFTAEGLLRNHEWSKEALIEAWMADPVEACQTAGVTLPQNHIAISEGELVEKNKVTILGSLKHSEVCSICEEEIVPEDVPLSLSCGHEFCRCCWESYLNVKIREGKAHSIQCPSFNCSALVPVETIESVVSREMARRYVQFDIKAFVESNPNIKWCPAPGCGRAVRLPVSMLPDVNGATGVGATEETEPIIVDCGGGHFFCWQCLHEAHAPCSCELWSRWLKKIAEMMAKIPTVNDISQCPETEAVANTLWLVTNSKNCPNCKSPIQKNEGCNHMKCTKCKHEFCWVCLEPWKKHSSATGGYFRCNRFEIVQKIESESVKAVNKANTRSMEITEINCFLHYYSRCKNHENSYKFEEPLLSTAKDKMMALAITAMETAALPENADTTFIEGGIQELLRARRVLRASYAYGYFLTGNSDKKAIFESMQTEVEEVTETLSQMIARPYLRTPRSQIIQTTQQLQQKRQDFLLALSRGLIPEDDQLPNIVSKLHLLSNLTRSRDSESDEDEDNYDEVRYTIERSIRQRLDRLASQEASQHGFMTSADDPCEQPSEKETLPCAFLHKKFNLTCCDLCNHDKIRHKREVRKTRRGCQGEPSDVEEVDVDFMRAIQLSLLQHSTPANKRSRQSSSSSSSGSSAGGDQARGGHTQDDFSLLSISDSSGLQRAIELSLQDSSVACTSNSEPSYTPPDDDLSQAIKLSLQDSGVSPDIGNESSNTNSSAPSHDSREQLNSDSNSEFDFCI